MAAAPQKITGPDSYEQAERKTRFGRKDGPEWIGYKTRQGELVAEVLTRQSLKRALLEKGTGGRFTHFVDGHRMRLTWRTGLNLLAQLRYPQGGGPGILSPERNRPRLTRRGRAYYQQGVGLDAR